MKILSFIFMFFMIFSSVWPGNQNKETQINPLAQPGTSLIYRQISQNELPGSVVRTIHLTAGPTEKHENGIWQWLILKALKENQEFLTVRLLCNRYPSGNLPYANQQIKRYLLQEGNAKPVEFLHQRSKAVILPTTGAWEYLIPRAEDDRNPFTNQAEKIHYLGHLYRLEKQQHQADLQIPQDVHLIRLFPQLLTGVPHNTRQKDETRRYDESDYEYIALEKADYEEMIGAGLNCFYVDSRQVRWIENTGVYYWGLKATDIVYPDYLYRSNYIGPVLFFDEPMVRTRDYVVKPKLQKDPDLRKDLTVQKVLEDFKTLYHETKYEEGSTVLIKGLNDREDVDTGEMSFLQQNLYTWETMVSSALYQLSEGNSRPPYAMVFEPPGRFGTRRVLPELNMCFDCQIPADDPKNLADMIFSFLRGAARVTDKEWGTSIYGAVDPADTFWHLTHAYDLGASLFFYWDSYQLACVPYTEYLTMGRHLQNHARQNPNRDLNKLKNAAETAILIPSGYNLGHVTMGRGAFWGIPELHPDRPNGFGATYRQVMSNFYTEVERCIRLGIAYDSFWQLDDLNLEGYTEIVTIREDGRVGIKGIERSELLDRARIPQRPGGIPPELSVEISIKKTDESADLIARAIVKQGSAPVFYTQGSDKMGVHNNIYVLWELYGPGEEDYYYPWRESWQVMVFEKESHTEVEINIPVNKPGRYRLRAATSDLTGRSTVVWKEVKLAIGD